MTRKSYYFVFLLVFVFSGNCMAFSHKKEVAHLCLMNALSNFSCGRSAEYVGVFRVLNNIGIKDEKILNFDISKEKTIDNVAIYKIRINNNNNKEWCFDFLGKRSKIHGFDEAPILEGEKISLMVFSSLKVSTSRTNASVTVCNIGLEKGAISEIILLVGSSKKVIYLARTPSLWVSKSDTIQKVIDKTSLTVKRDSYFFVDINENNAVKILELVKKGRFPYLLIYGTTWAKTMGSYQINTESYPHGIEGLIGVSKLASQRNIKIGLHVLTALVSKNDPLAAPLPDLGLLKVNNTLVEKYGYYLVDLKGSLKYKIADRIADVMNQTHAGMIYFDGGEASSSSIAANAEYDIAEQQMEVLKRLQGLTLVQGSGNVSRLWPYLSRMALDDFATLAPVEYLDFHKIGQRLPMSSNNLMPAELGWIGLLAQAPSYPATTPEDIATYMARALALNIPFSVETDEASLDANPYTAKLLSILGAANQVLQAGGVSVVAKKALKIGSWYYVDGSTPYFSKLNVQKKMGENKSIVDLGVMTKKASGIMLRLSNIRAHNKSNMINLLPKRVVIDDKIIEEKSIDDTNRGLLVERLVFNVENEKNGSIDITNSREMRVGYFSKLNNNKIPCSVLNLQLEDVDGFFRDYYLKITPNKESLVLINYMDAPSQMLSELMPAYVSYPMKSAIYHFNFSKVVAMNIRWMKTCNVGEKVFLRSVAMVQEEASTLNTIEFFIGSKKILDVPLLKTGEILDVFPNGDVTICKREICQKMANISSLLPKNIGNQHVYIRTKGNAMYDIVFGELTSKIRLGGFLNGS